eukprot:TRINITY_DN6430_c0_g1_i5.p3 TRINITY_DN6430_c0_g1~~TRINITY_DN6430_c0_g1_i5.p3  ORF type:complete len:285 (-),score=-10.00 TRINITY_DN6430_c0_g1_i5:894-1748(-)
MQEKVLSLKNQKQSILRRYNLITRCVCYPAAVDYCLRYFSDQCFYINLTPFLMYEKNWLNFCAEKIIQPKTQNNCMCPKNSVRKQITVVGQFTIIIFSKLKSGYFIKFYKFILLLQTIPPHTLKVGTSDLTIFKTSSASCAAQQNYRGFLRYWYCSCFQLMECNGYLIKYFFCIFVLCQQYYLLLILQPQKIVLQSNVPQSWCFLVCKIKICPSQRTKKIGLDHTCVVQIPHKKRNRQRAPCCMNRLSFYFKAFVTQVPIPAIINHQRLGTSFVNIFTRRMMYV